MNNKKVRAGAHRTKTSIAAHGSVLLVFEILPNGEDILSRATQVARQDVFVRMREQLSQPSDLAREIGTWRGRFRCRTGGGPSEERRPFEGVAPAAHGRRRRDGLGRRRRRCQHQRPRTLHSAGKSARSAGHGGRAGDLHRSRVRRRWRGRRKRPAESCWRLSRFGDDAVLPRAGVSSKSGKEAASNLGTRREGRGM